MFNFQEMLKFDLNFEGCLMSNKGRIKKGRLFCTWCLSIWKLISRNFCVVSVKLGKTFHRKPLRHCSVLLHFLIDYKKISRSFLFHCRQFVSDYGFFCLYFLMAELDVSAMQGCCFLPWPWGFTQVRPSFHF